MSPSPLPFLALTCIGAFATAPAFAEPSTPAADPAAAPVDGPEDQRHDVVVVGQKAKEDDPKQVAPLVNTPKSILVLPREVIEQTGSNSLSDALRTVPGITFGAAEGGNPIGDRPFIRGFDSQGSIYVDGVRDLAAQSREVFAVDSVQIVRGSDSTLGGRGSPGGTINIVSKVPQARTFGAVSASYGEADYKRVSADLNVALSPTITARVEGVWHDQDVAGRDAIHQRRWGVAPSITIGIGTPTRLTAAYYHLQSHELPDSGIPYLYTIGNAPGTGTIVSRPALGSVTLANGQTGIVPRSAFYGLVGRDFRDTETDQATLRVEHDFGRVTLRNTARFSDDTQAYIYTQPDDSQGNGYGTTATNTGANLTSGGFVWRRANTRYGYVKSIVDQLDLYGTLRTGGVEHSFSVGTEFSWEKARRGTFVTRGLLNANGVEVLSSGSLVSPRCSATTVARAYCASLFSPDPYAAWTNYASDTAPVASPIVRSVAAEETQNDAATQAVYAFDSITLGPKLILNLGARYDRFHGETRPGQIYAATQGFTLSRTDHLFNWQAGLVFKPTRSTSLYASYATSSTPPNALLGEGREDNALPTTAATASLTDDLRVQKTRSYEVGAKAQLFGDKLALTLAAFETRIDNARVTSDANTVAYLGKTRIRGVELSYNGVVRPGWTVFGGYTHLDAVVLDGGYTALAVPAVTGRTATTAQVVAVTTGKRLPQIARNSFTLYTNVSPWKRLTIGGGAIYSDKVVGGYADNRSATQNPAGVVTVTPATKLLVREVPAYWRFDANASFHLTRNVDLSVNAQNLTNKAYSSQAYTSHYAAIAPGRTVFGTVKLGF